MKIIYMGTPEFAVPPLKRLIAEGYSVPLVISQPDRARGRGKKILPTAVKAEAEKYEIPVHQPEGKEAFQGLLQLLNRIKPDVIAVAAYGRILPKELLDLPKFGCVNIHASLLPKYRGAAPIQHAILSEDKKTGVTLMYMSEGMDEGDIIASRDTAIDRKTAGELFHELSYLGSDLLIDTLPDIWKGIADRTAQEEAHATYAPKIGKADCLINFKGTAAYIEKQIRAMNPRPGAYTTLKGKVMKVFSAEIEEAYKGSKPGEICRVDDHGISVATGEKNLLIRSVQMPGKQILEVSEFIKGNKIEIGSVLG